MASVVQVWEDKAFVQKVSLTGLTSSSEIMQKMDSYCTQLDLSYATS